MYYTDLFSIPVAHYSIVLADPPWVYRDKALAGQRGAGCKYVLMPDDDIMDLPVSSWCAPDAACFMWATMPKLPEALTTMAAWGFQYKTVAFTWVKTNKRSASWFWGMGRWTRANAELVLLGTRGKPKRLDAGVHSIVSSPIGPHSRKPAEVRDRIHRLLGSLPSLELFGRGAAPGWDTYGNTPVWETQPPPIPPVSSGMP